jgi:hypothetical protein
MTDCENYVKEDCKKIDCGENGGHGSDLVLVHGKLGYYFCIFQMKYCGSYFLCSLC